ncbi:MAG: BMC domain-containing protein [Andreesenia angusta]|nr:BMC domain-containing protein [Andreesenia angusta]
MGIALGVAEFKSIAVGLDMLDKMTKTATIEIVDNRIVCIGKFLITVSGEVADVQSAINRAKEETGSSLIAAEVIPSVMDGVIEKINARIDRDNISSIGIFETKTLSSGILCANKIKKTSQVELLRVSLTLGLGGKSLIVFTGDIASVKAALEAAKGELSDKNELNKLVSDIAIASPSQSFIEKFNA